jgi:hypothetical protein
MVSHDLACVVDQTPAVAGEGPSLRHGVKVSEGIDPVATWYVL